ncbi:MAG: hypothetical protein OEY38_12430 [Gammaproteobacteria bacterium]|nr:hypothetical protein [Gammaproteobacteria bacterium]
MGLCFLLLCACNHQPPIITVSPQAVPLRQATQIDVKIEGHEKTSQIYVSAGGPYLEKIYDIDAVENLVSDENWVWFSRKNGLYRIEKNRNKSKPQRLKNFASKPSSIVLYQSTVYVFTKSGHYIFENDSMSPPTFVYKPHAEFVLIKQTQASVCAVDVHGDLSWLDLNSRAKDFVVIEKSTYRRNLAAFENGCIAEDDRATLALINTQGEKKLFKLDRGPVFDIHVKDNLIFLARGDMGFTIYERRSNQLFWRGSYNKVGPLKQLALHDHYLVASDGENVFRFFDIQDLSNPLLVSDYRSEQVWRYWSLGSTLLGASKTQLVVVNFEQKSTPRISTIGINLGGSRRSSIRDNFLYVADWFSGLKIYDVSNAEQPRLVSSYHTPGSPKGVLLYDNLIYVADDDKGLQVLDISDPYHPQFVFNLALPGLAYTMQRRDNILFLASHYGGFHILDISQPRKPSLISSIDTLGKPWALALKENYLYVADDNAGILIFDISNLLEPKLISQFNPQGLQAEDIVIRGDTAFVAYFDGGLMLLDIRERSKPKIKVSLNTPGNARGIVLNGDTLYLASWDAGVLIIDISDETQPLIRSQLDTQGAAWGLSIAGDNIYVMDWWGGVKIINGKNIDEPSLLSKYQAGAVIEAISIEGKFAYLAAGDRGLQVFDVSNPLNPLWTTAVDVSSKANDVLAVGSRVMLASDDLHIVDTSNPYQSYRIQTLSMPHKLIALTKNQEYVFALDETGTVKVLALNPEQVRVLQSLELKWKAMTVLHNELYGLGRDGFIYHFDLHEQQAQRLTDQRFQQLKSSPTSLVLVNQHQALFSISATALGWELQKQATLPAKLSGFHCDDLHCYASVGENSLWVFKLSSTQWPLVLNYDSSHRVSAIAGDGNGLLFAGETVLSSARLLPHIKIQTLDDGFKLSLPKDMPIGYFDIILRQNDGETYVKHNAFNVGFVKPKKKKFTLDDLKKIMQQKQFEGKAP